MGSIPHKAIEPKTMACQRDLAGSQVRKFSSRKERTLEIQLTDIRLTE